MAGGRLPEEAIRLVRERASLTEVVSDVVALRRRSRGAVGLCPFHAEKTPSFTVSEERGFYHCFGCGEHGDVFAFVMRTESLPFPEAVRRVAERFGVALPEPVAGARERGEPLAAVTASAAAFFRAELAGAGGAAARAYLRERGLGEEVVARFGLGWAPGGGEALVRGLRAKGHAVEDMLGAGLVMRRERPDGRSVLVDRFRERLVFPIGDPFGKVIGFGGRVLPGRPASGDPPPKYLNSPDTPLFHKGRTLYGLAQAREAIRRTGRAVVVEGYIDVLALAQAGVAEVVAPLGTALTAEQLRVLRRLTEQVVACFDGDAAGTRAAARSFPVFLEAGLWGRGAFLPAGDDPDTFVRAHGAGAFEARLAAAEPLVEAFVDDLAGPDRTAVGRKTEAAREVARLLKRVRNPLEHDVLAHLAAERLGVREQILRAEAAGERPEVRRDAPPPGDRALTAEELLLVSMAADPAVARRVREERVLDDFERPAWRQLGERLAAGGEAGAASLLDALPDHLRDAAARRLLGEIGDEVREQEVRDCIAAIRRQREERIDMRRLHEQMRAAEQRGDTAAFQEAQRRFLSLKAAHTQKDVQIGARRENPPGSE